MIDTTNVKPGDRVRLTAEDGATAEFTVVNATSYALASKRNVFVPEEWEKLEVLEPVKPTLTEQYLALAPGTRFMFTTNWCTYMKITDSHFALLYKDGYAAMRKLEQYAGSRADIRVVEG